MDQTEAFLKLKNKKGKTEAESFEFYDRLEPVSLEFMRGVWKGEGFPTNHPMDGLLEAFDWYGKEFVDQENVHPLLFQHGNGKIYRVHPGRVPLGLAMIYPHNLLWLVKPFFRLGKLFLKTKKSKARIRLVDFRGKQSVAMIYDDLPIYDHFRRIDQNTVLGVMDLKGLTQYFFFVLHRV
jgi:hypothetical protein